MAETTYKDYPAKLIKQNSNKLKSLKLNMASHYALKPSENGVKVLNIAKMSGNGDKM